MTDKYQRLVEFLFDRDESAGDWRFDYDLVEPDLTGEEFVKFFRQMLENYEADLSAYSDWQLGMGMNYIFNNSCSNLSLILRDGPVAIDKRVNAIRALKAFFGECLNQRCVSALGHLSENGNQLNHFCYIVWDITPLAYCEQTPEKTEIYAAVAEVMRYALSLDNIACVESGLHGLGHLERYYDRASAIVRSFISSGGAKDERIIAYARQAEKGCVL